MDLFAALNVATGQVVAQTKKQHRSRDFVSFLREIDERVDPTLTVHVILDNLSAHKSPLVKRWRARHPRFQFHFTPTYSAWLNLVERFFGLLTEHALKRGSHSSTHALRHAISAYVDAHNDEGKPFKWTKTADEILAKVKRFGQRTVLRQPTPPGSTSSSGSLASSPNTPSSAAHIPARPRCATPSPPTWDAHNDEGKPFKWTKTADEILAKVKRFGQRTVQVHGGPR